jgi:branched-chain amino acid transport system substrate-binding protein
MKMAKTILQVLGTAAFCMIVAAPAQSKVIKVGVVLPFSGSNADQADEIAKAIELYVKVHQKELGADKIELIKRDSGAANGAGAKRAVAELITQDHVRFLTGFEFSPDAIASAPIVTQAKVPMIISNAGTAWITQLSPYIARVSFSMWDAAYPMGEYAFKHLGCHTAAVAYTDYPPGKDSRTAFKTEFEAAGGKVIDDIPMGNPSQVPDFTPFLQRVRDEKPQCVYVFVPAGNHATHLIKTYREVGLRKAGIKLIGDFNLIPDDHLQEIGSAAVGLILMGHYSADYTNPANRAFVKEWHAQYGENSTPNFLAVGGWDSMAAIFHAIKTLHGKVDDAGKVMATLEGWSTDSPRGPITIDAKTRDIIQDEHVEEVYKKPDGKLAVKVLDTVHAVKDPCKEHKIGRCK